MYCNNQTNKQKQVTMKTKINFETISAIFFGTLIFCGFAAVVVKLFF